MEGERAKDKDLVNHHPTKTENQLKDERGLSSKSLSPHFSPPAPSFFFFVNCCRVTFPSFRPLGGANQNFETMNLLALGGVRRRLKYLWSMLWPESLSWLPLMLSEEEDETWNAVCCLWDLVGFVLCLLKSKSLCASTEIMACRKRNSFLVKWYEFPNLFEKYAKLWSKIT